MAGKDKKEIEKQNEKLREILLKCNAIKEPDKKDIRGHRN